LILYKRIASTRDAGELRDLQVEMSDRFGLLLPQVILGQSRDFQPWIERRG